MNNSKYYIKKRILSFILAVCLAVPMLTGTASAASNDYTTWKQYDNAWGNAVAWPRSQYPNATMRTLGEAGCLVSSIAILLRHYGVVTESDVNRFNPWTVNEQLKANGCFDSAADLIWNRVKKAYPGFQYAGKKNYSLSALTDLYKKGYACIVQINNGMHYVAIRSINGSTVKMMDPGSRNTTLPRRGCRRIYYFKVTSSSGLPTISGENAPTSLKYGQTYSIRGIISSGSKITSVTAGVYTSESGSNMVTGKTVTPNSTTYDLKNIDPYVYFDRLGSGYYYYIVKATNSAGEKILIKQLFSVGGNSFSDKWCTLAPKCAPQSRLDVYDARSADRTNVQLYASNGTNAQQWKLLDLGNGYYAIQSKVSGEKKCLDVSGGTAKSGTNVWLFHWNGSNAQQWKFVDAGDGYYYICSRLNENLCLDVWDARSANGTNVQVYTRNNTNAQKWKINW